MNPKTLHLVVLLGGPSAEREVSLRSGRAVAEALRSRGHRVTEIDPVPGALKPPPATDAVFIALHGTYGEDGSVQEELGRLDLPFTGCDVESSRVAFDKVLTKRRLESAGLPTPRFAVLEVGDEARPADLRLPLVLKPVDQGSSVGLEFVETEAEWTAKLRSSRAHGRRILVEEKVEGREITVGVLAGAALPIVEVRPRAGAYDYRNKYTPGATEYFCPAPLDAPVTGTCQRVGLAAFEVVGGRDYGRVDLMIDAEGNPFVLEVNTLPGMTETSLFPKAAAAAGIDYADLCERMVLMAMNRAPSPARETF